MPKAAFLFPLLLLAACSTTKAAMPARACSPGASKSFVGQPGTSETGAAILRATHSAVIRWAPPGGVLTMDFRIDRVTVRLGPDGKITGINCG
jgi:hypothetical protein